MHGDMRRTQIITKLIESEHAISANQFARRFNVSRQIIVGDVALLRAQGHDIIATGKGYLMNRIDANRNIYTLAMQHNHQDTQRELEIFIKHHAQVLDVTVEHPIYGYLTGQLNIQSQEDIDLFMNQNPELLASLTNGIHLHRVAVSEENYADLITELKKHAFLYESN
ncbi:transcription repressor NadR [Erysipelothrix sp. strain 2 (EsS2-7-Brazil)]|uniref:transcription repressor NadR n=1 Tax=Erysipelothrix TaxID=1647 RepID=UPI00190DB8A2|nr:transcription repressor NadR [Erysipelothrix sp. strain 2 (EsS2-7-Brazil)]MBK2403849.1 transcription repressor NadR [Erysipelothrix sp. strain 2 (EsS2-7-Brazil)]